MGGDDDCACGPKFESIIRIVCALRRESHACSCSVIFCVFALSVHVFILRDCVGSFSGDCRLRRNPF